jgi:hypothetical protein
MKNIIISLLLLITFRVSAQISDTTDLLNQIYFNQNIVLDGSYELKLSKVVLHTQGWQQNGLYLDVYDGGNRGMELSYTKHNISEVIESKNLEFYEFNKEGFFRDYLIEKVNKTKSTDFRTLWGPAGGDPSSRDFNKRVDRYVQQQFGELFGSFYWSIKEFANIQGNPGTYASNTSLSLETNPNTASKYLNLFKGHINNNTKSLSVEDFNNKISKIRIIDNKFIIIGNNQYILERHTLNYPFYHTSYRFVLTNNNNERIALPIVPIQDELYLILSYKEMLQFIPSFSSFPINGETDICRYYWENGIQKDCRVNNPSENFWDKMQPDTLFHVARKKNRYMVNSKSVLWNLFQTPVDGYYLNPQRMQFLFKLNKSN